MIYDRQQCFERHGVCTTCVLSAVFYHLHHEDHVFFAEECLGSVVAQAASGDIYFVFHSVASFIFQRSNRIKSFYIVCVLQNIFS